MQNIVFIEREYQPHILKNQNKREMGGEIYISYNIVAYNSNISFKTKLYVKELHVLWFFFLDILFRIQNAVLIVIITDKLINFY